MAANTPRKGAQRNARLRVVAGGDESRVKARAAEIAAEWTPEGTGAFGCEIVDCAVENADQAAARIAAARAALDSPGLFASERLVWLKSVSFLSDTVVGRANVVLAALEGLATMLEDGADPMARILISIVSPDKRRAFYKKLAAMSDIEIYDRLEDQRGGAEALQDFVQTELKRRGITSAADTIHLLLQLAGGDSRLLLSEIEKLDLYLGDRRELRANDVRELVALTREGVVFELGNAIAARQLSRAMSLLDRLLQQGEQPLGILLASLAPTVRNLLLARDLMDRHRIKPSERPQAFVAALNALPEAATAHLPRKKDGSGLNIYPIAFAAMHARAFSRDRLLDHLDECLRANTELVSTQTDARVILSRLVARIVNCAA